MPGSSSTDLRAPLADADIVPTVPVAPAPPPIPGGMRSRVLDWVLATGAVLAVFFVHFRPWQGGLLEDWGLVRAWDTEGFAGFVTRLPLTLGRPLHLLPDYIGMALSNGGFVGYYAVLGVVAVTQLAAALWAVAPLTDTRSLRWAVALAIALHPWWAAGDILRFTGAQVSVLGVVVWLGASIRFLANGRGSWALLLVVAPMVGLLSYQAPAVTIALAAVVVAPMSRAGWRRQIALVVLTVGTSVAVMTWSVVIAPRIAPASYEAQLGFQGLHLVPSVRAILRTLVLHAPSLVFALLLVAAGVIALGFNRHLPSGRAWLLLLATAATPLAAIAYVSQAAHLNDPERVALPVGLMLWVVVCCALPALNLDRTVRLIATAALLAGTTMGAFVGYATWTAYAASQQVLIKAIQPVRNTVPHDARLVIADQSGRFGDVYLLLPPYLNIALDVEYGPGADVALCTPAGVVRDQPSAALFPIATTPDCSMLLHGKVVTPMNDLATTEGTFKVYKLAPADSAG